MISYTAVQLEDKTHFLEGATWESHMEAEPRPVGMQATSGTYARERMM